jgi:predicted RND superfamily exporter protein
VLRYLAGLQAYLEQAGIVGKTTSVADVVRKVNQELVDGREENFRIPDKTRAVSECYLQYQQSHRPNDLWHLVTPDFMSGTIQMQFTRGDSSQTRKAVDAVDSYLKENPPPVALSHRWSGLHYVNLVFQDIMFRQMLGSFLGAFVIVFFMVAFLFRSFVWAGACMIPLTLTITAIYGVTGIIGKDYDMPVAVLSAITLGIAVDFGIHFLERNRAQGVRGARPCHRAKCDGCCSGLSAAHGGPSDPVQGYFHPAFRDSYDFRSRDPAFPPRPSDRGGKVVFRENAR